MFIGQATCRCGRPECDGGSLDKRLIIGTEEYDSYLPGYDSDVTSGFRCPFWNIHEGGSEKSFHPKRMAIDFKTRGLTPQDMVPVAEMVDIFYNGGIGVYIYDKNYPGWDPEKFKGKTGFLHCDIRGWKARWFFINRIQQTYGAMVESRIFDL